MMRTLRLMADYGSYPVWEVFEDGLDNLETQTLPISDELKLDIQAWDKRYEKTINDDYPPDGGFMSSSEEVTFEQQGRSLWQRLKNELGSEFMIEPYREHRIGLSENALTNALQMR